MLYHIYVYCVLAPKKSWPRKENKFGLQSNVIGRQQQLRKIKVTVPKRYLEI